MKRKISIACILAFGVLPGCTGRTVYDSLRYNQQLRCQDLQGRDRDACLQQSDMSYDEYQRHLKERDADR
jgi:hypothetical protein